MCLENHWGHGVKEKAREIYWGSYESSNQLWAFHLVPPSCRNKGGADPRQETPQQSMLASQSKGWTHYGNP